VRLTKLIVLFGATALLCAVVAFSYRAKEPSPQRYDLVRKDFSLGTVPLAIMLPPATVARIIDADTIDFNTTPERRTERRLILKRRPRPQDTAYTHASSLTNGGVVAYNVSVEKAVGSGGQEAQLSGFLEMPGLTVLVTCRDQSKDSPRPDWCLPLLDHLSIASRPR
jgi:hypothetical protein